MPTDRHIKTGPVIRQMNAADWAIIRPLRLRALSDSPSAFGSSFAEQSKESDAQWIERIEQLTDPRRAGMWLAFLGEDAVGMVAGVKDEKDPRRAWLISMWVAPDARRHGLGQALIHHVIDWADQSGMDAMHLHVTDGNDPARRLYERLGFQTTGETMPHPRIPNLIEHEMRRVLGM